MIRHYILDERGEPTPADRARWFEQNSKTKNRVVKREKVGDAEVSTVFLGLDHNFDPEGPPLIWETMVFGGEHDQEWMDRCSGTREQAEAMHQRMVEELKKETKESSDRTFTFE